MRRRAGLLAWSLLAGFVAISAVWVALEAANGEALLGKAGFTFVYSAFAFVGALVASRKPDNPLGWIFLGIGTAANLGNAASAYAIYGLVTEPGALPAAEWAAWLGSFLWPAAITSILLLLVLFPSGRPQRPFERWLLRVALLAIASLVVGSFALRPGPLDVSGIRVDNPAGVQPLSAILSLVAALGGVLVPFVAFTAVVTLVVRARRSRGVERQQLKWFGYSALAMVLFAFVIGNLIKVLFPPLAVLLGDTMFAVGLSFIPLGTGVAILRYRLYDIDLIVNRTLVYAGLTSILALAYLGIVVVLQEVLGFATRDSDLAVAGSTLAVAALFRPLRERVQSFIDHRFYRRKYDAAETLERFTGRLREQVDLASLSGELVAVVGSTMQPAHVSLWLTEETRS